MARPCPGHTLSDTLAGLNTLSAQTPSAPNACVVIASYCYRHQMGVLPACMHGPCAGRGAARVGCQFAFGSPQGRIGQMFPFAGGHPCTPLPATGYCRRRCCRVRVHKLPWHYNYTWMLRQALLPLTSRGMNSTGTPTHSNDQGSSRLQGRWASYPHHSKSRSLIAWWSCMRPSRTPHALAFHPSTNRADSHSLARWPVESPWKRAIMAVSPCTL